MAESGINVMKRECIGKRFRTKDEAETLPARLSDWQDKKNAEKKPYRLKFTVEKARKHPHLYNTEPIPGMSSENYAEQNALCLFVPQNREERSLVPYGLASEDGEIIDLCRSIDEEGHEYWALSLGEKRVSLREPVGKKQITPILGQKNTADGWLIPIPSKPRTPKEEGKKASVGGFDYNFMAYGEDLVALYNQELDANRPIICIEKRGLDLNNLEKNAWVGNLQADSKPKKKKKVEESTNDEPNEPVTPTEEEKDSRLGITFIYNPFTGEKWFLLNDYSDDSSWAEALELVYKAYPNASEIQIVISKEAQDKIGALEQVFKPDRALQIYQKFKIHIAPKNGRWLNFAENEAITVCRQCLKYGFS